jgi:excisionase family DNA binding protein
MELQTSSSPAKRPRRPNESLKPVTATIDDVRRMTGLGLTKIYELIGEGKLKTVTIGRRRLVFLDSVDALLKGGVSEAAA